MTDRHAEARRAIVVVMDACGAGATDDADAYGDADADTLVHLAEAVGGLELPVLGRLGLGNVRSLLGVPPALRPGALHGRLHPAGPGKDSTTGHWELFGVVADAPLPTYPEGFPPAVLGRIELAAGRRCCCNAPYEGIAAIHDFGEHHRATGELILYTSVDSVLQIAAHVDVVPEAELYAICARVREVMRDEHAVGRVIARPFTGEPGAFRRTEGRRDLVVQPPGPSHVDLIADLGLPTHAVGKVADLFAGRGFSDTHPGATNAVALERTTALLRDVPSGLIATNLVETDQTYGHRKDVAGFAAALRAIDDAVGEWLALLRPGDLLVLTADHGCDPTTPGTDHTREHAPLLAVFADHGGRRHDGPLSDVGASAAAWLGVPTDRSVPGTSFVTPVDPSAA
ncbi:phosphopentomutase [Paraconexibacter algicola]|nr:phosphopentomutase [Paraconexibacter algicola]